MIENTSRRHPTLHLLGADGSSRYIEQMEAAGQRQLVNSDRLPTKLNNNERPDFEAFGFTLGEPDSDDPLFRPAALPDGWRREGSDHAMWSYIVDQYGRRRVAIFYKAAWYDRDAFMSLYTHYRYVREVLWNGGTPVLDDEWLTREAALAALEKIRDGELSEASNSDKYAARGDRGYWSKSAEEHRKTAAQAERSRQRLAEEVAG